MSPKKDTKDKKKDVKKEGANEVDKEEDGKQWIGQITINEVATRNLFRKKGAWRPTMI